MALNLARDNAAAPLRLARRAMATRFEIVLYGEDPVNLQAAGEEALDEIDRLEAQLSLYRPDSEVSEINARAGREPVRVTPPLFRLLRQAREISAASRGAFDVTVGPLMKCWGFMGDGGRLPDPEEWEAARKIVGMDLIELDEENSSVRFRREGVRIDLGAIGKGYALEQAANLLRENGVTQALLHGGTSSVIALGGPPTEESGWPVALRHPSLPQDVVRAVRLRDESLSVSGVHGKAFEANGRRYGHVMDPRIGEPVDGPLLAAVVLPSATETDALSTALLILGPSGFESLAAAWPGFRGFVALEDSTEPSGIRIEMRNWTGEASEGLGK
jgi:thiamine biosynthesis lipoprotein